MRRSGCPPSHSIKPDMQDRVYWTMVLEGTLVSKKQNHVKRALSYLRKALRKNQPNEILKNGLLAHTA